jgi:hypothetical protein
VKRKNALTFFVLTIMVVLMFGSQANANGVQLLTNPGFEDGGGSYNGWFTFGDGVQLSTPGTDNIFRTDSTAAKVYGEYTGCPIPNFDVGGFGQAFTPVAGKDYYFSGYSFVSSADTIPGDDTCVRNRLIAKIVFFNAASGGSEISSNEIILGDWSTPRDTWIPFTVSAPTPPGALRVEALILFLQPGCDDGAVFVDDLYFWENPTQTGPNVLTNPSFDTDLSGWTVFGNVYYDGRAFALRTPTGSAALYGTFNPDFDSGMYQRIDTDPGASWTLSVYALNTCVENAIRGTNQNIAYAIIEYRDVSGVSLGGDNVVICDSTSALGTWTNYQITATAPAGTDSVDAMILFTQGPLLENGKVFVDDIAFFEGITSNVSDMPRMSGVKLFQNFPNPFNPTTRIAFELTQHENVEISVYDVTGALVTTLHRGHLGEGPHSVTWDGTAANGESVASGVYLYVLHTATEEVARRMVLLK